MTLTTDHRLYIETQVAAQRKSMGVAYALWFFLGLLSIHRFYLNRPGTAILQIILNCLVVGLLWTLIDAFLIPGMIRDNDAKVRAELYRYAAPDLDKDLSGPPPDMTKWSKRDREAYERKQLR